MNKIEYILSEVRKETDSVILFSSLTGKDSILLTHYCAEIFNKVESVYMYLVKDLDHVNKYQRYFERRYGNIEFHQVPHFTKSWHIRTGFLGIKKDKNQKKYQLRDIDELMREKTGINWSVYGMKQSDCLNRRVQLRQYKLSAICEQSQKVYPLSEFTNNQVLQLIEKNNLPLPISYNNDRSQSQDINDIDYLIWLYNNYPNDLLKTFEAYPGTRQKVYEWQEANKTE